MAWRSETTWRKIPVVASRAGIQTTGLSAIATNGSPGQSRWSGPGADVATVPISLTRATPGRTGSRRLPASGRSGRAAIPAATAGAVEADERASKLRPSNVTWTKRDPFGMEPPESEFDADPECLEGHRLPQRDPGGGAAGTPDAGRAGTSSPGRSGEGAANVAGSPSPAESTPLRARIRRGAQPQGHPRRRGRSARERRGSPLLRAAPPGRA